MKNSEFSRRSLAASLAVLTLVSCSPSLKNSASLKQTASNSIITEAIDGVDLAKVSSELQNPWTKELEAEFQKRAASIIKYYANPKSYGNGFQENEKRSYPAAMFDFLAGNRERAIEFLQKEDPQAKDHQHTEGIDFYFCFTLKGQIRKYFLFGEYLDPEYKQRMYRGAKKWTEKDPLARPHPVYGMGDGSGRDWSIQRRGRWVDARNTDNLRAMREVAVYLMAEETGNEETRLLYKKKLQRYVGALYNIGMGEWDSENYLGHTFAPYVNLYDFAKDPEVKKLAKAALDWISAAAAVKYYRGGWGGPNKRDYGGSNVVFTSSAARTFSLYFGDTIIPNPKPESDTIHLITSTYRPPLAVVALARKQFDRPVELLSTKPVYENWKPGNDEKPGYWETTFFGQTYQMGSLVGTFADGDVAPFKLMAYNSDRGVDYFVANSGGNMVRPGKKPGDQIGQYRNLLIWLRPADDKPFFFQLPRSAKAEIENDIWFFQLEKTWLALRPINLSERVTVPITKKKLVKVYSQEQTFKVTTVGNSYAGFALEVGEDNSHGSYTDFKQSVIKKSQLDLKDLASGKVKLKGMNGNSLQLRYNTENLLPFIFRGDKEYDWSKNFALYNSLSNNKQPIDLGWKIGKLKVRVKDLEFQNKITKYSNLD
ncbi:MAG: hypothetical protein QNJ54_25670 [Prochloraceae cyanobacterium]|nr:hypothetical protein [Prochloraceae cyanobacterium]